METVLLVLSHLAVLGAGFALGVHALHWGEGTISVGPKTIGLVRLKPRMVRVGDIKTFRNFLVPVPEKIDPTRYDTVVVRCETFSQFIGAAQYR